MPSEQNIIKNTPWKVRARVLFMVKDVVPLDRISSNLANLKSCPIRAIY